MRERLDAARASWSRVSFNAATLDAPSRISQVDTSRCPEQERFASGPGGRGDPWKDDEGQAGRGKATAVLTDPTPVDPTSGATLTLGGPPIATRVVPDHGDVGWPQGNVGWPADASSSRRFSRCWSWLG